MSFFHFKICRKWELWSLGCRPVVLAFMNPAPILGYKTNKQDIVTTCFCFWKLVRKKHLGIIFSQEKKEPFMLFWPIFGNFWCPVVTVVKFSSNLSNFERNQKKQKSPKKIQKNPKNSKKLKKKSKNPRKYWIYLRRRHAQTVKNGASSHKTNYIKKNFRDYKSSRALKLLY